MMWVVPIESELLSTLETQIDVTDWDDRPAGFPLVVRVLGVTADAETGNGVHAERYWETMATGDPLLVYHRDSDQYIGFGRLGTKARTSYFDERFWYRGAHNVFTVESYDDSLDVQTAEVNEMLGYDPLFSPTGVTKVRSDRPIGDLLFYLDVNGGKVPT